MQLKFIAVTVLLALTGCGFTPVYSTSRIDSGELSAISIKPMPDRSGQLLRNTLLDRGFGDNPNSSGVELEFVGITEVDIDLGLAPDNTATRKQITITGVLRLTKNDEKLAERNLSARSTYNVLVSQYGTVVSRQAAEELAIRDLARQIETHTLLVLGDMK